MTTKIERGSKDDIYSKAYKKLSSLTNHFSDEDEKERIMRETRLGGCRPFTPENLAFGMMPEFEAENIYKLLQEIEVLGGIKEGSIVQLSEKDLLDGKFGETYWQKKANRQKPLRSE